MPVAARETHALSITVIIPLEDVREKFHRVKPLEDISN